MIIFLGPGRAETRNLGSEDTVIHGVEGLVEAAYSKLPEHASLKARVAEVSLRAHALAEEFGQALPEELRDFWAAYAGWFQMYSTGPLMANWHIGQRALAETTAGGAAVLEHWRSRSWWSGRFQIEPALRDELQAKGLRTRVAPGRLVRALQDPVMLAGARRQLRQLLMSEIEQLLLARSEGQLKQSVTAGAVLWLNAGGSSAELMARLIPHLRDQHRIPSEILDFHYYQSAEACRRHGLPYRDITTFLDDRCESEIRRARQWPRWWRHFRREAQDLACRQDLPPALFAALCRRMRVVLARDTGPWLVQAMAARQALDAYRPSAVVTFHVYGPAVMPVVVEARRRGIPCLCLQHGVIGPRYLALPCPEYDEMLVFGEYARGIMEQVCPPLMPVTVTGHSLYDSALRPGAVQPRPEVLALRDGVHALVVLCTQFNENMFHSTEDWWMAEVARACRELGARLAIKAHPSDPPAHLAWYRSLERPGDDSVVVVPHGQYPLAELLTACDAMVTRDSTVVFEANLLDRPVLTVNLSRWEEELPYAATGGAIGVYQYEEIRPALERVLNDLGVRERLAAARPAFLDAHTGPRDGQATGRIGGIIAAWARGERRKEPT